MVNYSNIKSCSGLTSKLQPLVILPHTVNQPAKAFLHHLPSRQLIRPLQFLRHGTRPGLVVQEIVQHAGDEGIPCSDGADGAGSFSAKVHAWRAGV